MSLAARDAGATAKTWAPSSGTSWNTSANWSPSGVPGSSDDVTFSSSNNSACSIDANVDVSSITVASGYTSNITPSGAQTIRVRNNLTVSGTGGTFTLSTGTTEIDGAYVHSSGTMAVTSAGTLQLSASSAVSHTFSSVDSFTNVTTALNTSVGLAAYWKLDETSGTTLADSSGNGNTGTLSGTYSRTTPPSAITFSDPEALNLNGTSSASVGVTNFPAIGTAQSIALWFKGVPNGGNENFIAFLSGSAATQLGFRGTALIAWAYGGGTLLSGTAPTDGNWHHVAYIYDGTNDKMYLDGSLFASATGVTHQTGTVTSAFIGTYDTNRDEPFVGSLDDIRIYNRALSAAEVSAMAGGSSGISGGTHTFSGTLKASGNFTVYAGTTVSGTATVQVGGSVNLPGTYSDTGAMSLVGTTTGNTVYSYGNTVGALTVNGSGGGYTFNDALSIGGNFTLGTGATVNATTSMTVAGSWSTGSGTFSTAVPVTFTGSGSQTITSGGAPFSALTLNATGGTYTLQDRLWLPAGTVTLTAGTLNGGSSSSVIAHVGNFVQTGGSFASGSGVLVVDSPTAQTFPLTSLGTVRFDTGTEAGLVGYWKADEVGGTTMRDASGNGNTGTLSAAGVTWNTSGAFSISTGFDNAGSIALNGTSGYVTLGTTNLPANNAVQSISLWYNGKPNGNNQNMIAINGSGGSELQLGFRSSTVIAWKSGGAALVSGTATNDTSWHHLVYTYDGTTDKLYVDGALLASQTGSVHQTGTATSAYLGTFSPPTSELFGGSLDDVRVYNTALTATQVANLFAKRYAGTSSGYAAVSLGGNTTISSLTIDSATLSSGSNTLTASGLATINAGIDQVGSTTQTFQGGLTVQNGGTLSLPTSGGTVAMNGGTTLKIDGTLSAASTGATIQSVSGTYAFTVGSTATATPTLNISGLAVQNTDANGMAIGFSTAAVPVVSKFDNIAFSNGTSGGVLLKIQSSNLYMSSNGCSFDGSIPKTTANTVQVVGNGNADGFETRAVFGSATCSSSYTSCQASKLDDDSNNDGVASNPTTNGGIAQFIYGMQDDTAGSIIGFPTAAFDWNTFTYYSTYVAFHNASSATNDVVYVRDETGKALYSWTVPTAGETITGTPQWNTVSSTHYLYVATNAGHVYRLVDSLSALTLDTAWSTNPFNCSCTISTPLALDANNLYWGASGNAFWTLGQSSETAPTGSPLTLSTAVTTAAPAIATISGTTTAFLGVTGTVAKISVAGQSLTASASLSSGSAAVWGRMVIGTSGANTRLYAGDDGNVIRALDTGSGFSGTPLGSFTTTSAIKSSPYYDRDTDTIQFGTQDGSIYVLNGTASAKLYSSYPYQPVAGDAITAAPVVVSGVLVVGSTAGRLYFIDRNTGSGYALIKTYAFGPSESVSGVGYDPNASRFMVSTSSASANDGHLYFFDSVTDPTPSTP
ncbi:MAG TPA: LamG-like jellyroll fold domain-containing protein [Polyangia bacterium]|nr:LamG-like jellyroll fold domain-containing protein [Polyangia bacterium]